MDAKRREEILKECDLGWLNQKLTDKMFDLAEKAVRRECDSLSKPSDVEKTIRLLKEMEINSKWKSAVEKALPCLDNETRKSLSKEIQFLWCDKIGNYPEKAWCDNCKNRKEIFKEVGLE